jgi:hypothetical protein
MVEAQIKRQSRCGRPSKKTSLDMAMVGKLARMGWTDAQMADFFGVDERTWHRWKADDEAFCQSLKAGKEEADARVERCLFERATGYSHPDVHTALTTASLQPSSRSVEGVRPSPSPHTRKMTKRTVDRRAITTPLPG